MKTLSEIVLSDLEDTAKKEIAKRYPNPFTSLSHTHTRTKCSSCSCPLAVCLIEEKKSYPLKN